MDQQSELLAGQHPLQRHFAYCAQISDDMKAKKTWPWASARNRCQTPATAVAVTSEQRGAGVSTAQGKNENLLTVAEAARFLTISVSGVRRLQQGRQIPFIKIGGMVRFARPDLAGFLEKHRVQAIDHKTI